MTSSLLSRKARSNGHSVVAEPSNALVGPNGESVEVVEVTPDLAHKWLGLNTKNRSLRKAKVAAYAGDMINQRWRFPGNLISFDSRGVLMNGQHTLTAIIEAEVTVPCIVVIGADPRAQDTMDIGAARSLGDQLGLRDEKSGKTLGAVVRNATRLTEGRTSFSGMGDLSNPRLLEEFEGDPDGFREAMRVGKLIASASPVAAGIMGAAYYVCAINSPEDARRFFCEQLGEGLGIQSGDPAAPLLHRFRRALKDGRRMHPDEQMRYTLLAWNAFREDRRLTKLQGPKGGWNQRNFPTPI